MFIFDFNNCQSKFEKDVRKFHFFFFLKKNIPEQKNLLFYAAIKRFPKCESHPIKAEGAKNVRYP